MGGEGKLIPFRTTMEALRTTNLVNSVDLEVIEDGDYYIVRLVNVALGHEIRALKTKDWDKAKAEYDYILEMFN